MVTLMGTLSHTLTHVRAHHHGLHIVFKMIDYLSVINDLRCMVLKT